MFPLPQSDNQMRERIVKLAAAGWSRPEIAREMGLTAAEVLRYLRSLGIVGSPVRKERFKIVRREPEEVSVGEEA
jgi:predicted transcriptional regulator